jgi:hypothetical protein
MKRSSGPTGVRVNNISISSYDDDAYLLSTFQHIDYDDSFKQVMLPLKLSLKDIFFITKMVDYLTKTTSIIARRPLLENSYNVFFTSFQDILHIPRFTFYHKHVDLSEACVIKANDTLINPFELDVLLHNNTYNIDMLKATLRLPRPFTFAEQKGSHTLAVETFLQVVTGCYCYILWT